MTILKKFLDKNSKIHLIYIKKLNLTHIEKFHKGSVHILCNQKEAEGVG